ncbi:MAG: FtsX-like permease family protein [Planctomycetes bacterium]|nr:FtsX-like permease family protein [Planctomycetota bacterium]
MYKLFLCLRYLRKRRIAFFGVTAVALCVGLLIVVTSLFNGFIDSYLSHRERLLGQIALQTLEPIAEYTELADHLEKLDQVAVAKPVVETGALLYLKRGDVRGVKIVGIDLERQAKQDSFRRGLLRQNERGVLSFALTGQEKQAARTWLETKLQRPISDDELPIGAILGIGVLAQPDETTDKYDRESIRQQIRQRDEGMQVTIGKLLNDQSGEVESQAQKKQRWFWLVDAVETGLNEADTRYAFLPFDYVKDMIGIRDVDGKMRIRASIQITATAGADVDEVIEQVKIEWSNFAQERLGWPESWVGALSQVIESTETRDAKLFTDAIRKQLAVMQLILGLICLVVALLIFVILMMIVMQKKKEIGIVRSIGSSQWGVAGIYLSFGGGVGVAGATVGLGLGWWATRNISIIEGLLAKLLGFKIWKSGVYMFRDIPNEVAWNSVIWIMAAGVISAVLGALLPALRAARMQPVDALRYE